MPYTPSTPIRPKRSSRRLTRHTDSIDAVPTLSPTTKDPLQNPIDDTPLSAVPATPHTPISPSPATPAPIHPRLANRKSTASIRRKPVPLVSDDLTFSEFPNPFDTETDTPIRTPSSSQTPFTPITASTEHFEPPRYILDVDMPPSTPDEASSARPPSYIRPNSLYSESDETPSHSMPDLTGISPYSGTAHEDLPTYAEEAQTEPKTLARALWKWGFACPLLWFIGMAILWIPLKPLEEEQDPEKAQKVDEMLEILRKTELRYAKRCMYAAIGFVFTILAIVAIAVAVSRAST